jgi:uncharacterized protein YacL
MADSEVMSMEDIDSQQAATVTSARQEILHDHSKASYAPHVWRLVFAVAFIALGAILGFELGVFVVNNVKLTPAYSSNAFLLAYKALLGQSGAIALLQELAFGTIGGLTTYLLAAVVFNKVIDFGESLKSMAPADKVAIFFGLVAGLALTTMLSPVLLQIPHVGIFVTIVVGIVLSYLGVAAAISMKDDIRFVLPSQAVSAAEEKPERAVSTYKILDTNVIIDGRITDICRTGFIEGPVYVPGFVLDELQHIADSSDALKRARGRRGLDILNQMRSEMPLIVRTLDVRADYQGVDEVDAKLVKLAKKLEGMIVTNDFNLNKVAELQGVTVLNINELANALKPVVLPGEEMHVTVIKEGKEMNQGIAYLDDGTMIVIEGARRRIGENLSVVVSSVLQTVAGKMIFATLRQDDDEEDDRSNDQGSRGYTGGRPRRPLR